MKTAKELEEIQQYANSVGHNVGNTIGEMCNMLMRRRRGFADCEPWHECRQNMMKAATIAQREISEMQGMIRELLEQKP